MNIISNSNTHFDNVVTSLAERFSLKYLGILSYFLGVEVLPNTKSIFYLKRIVSLTCMEYSTKPVATPLVTQPPLTFEGTSLSDHMPPPPVAAAAAGSLPPAAYLSSDRIFSGTLLFLPVLFRSCRTTIGPLPVFRCRPKPPSLLSETPIFSCSGYEPPLPRRLCKR
ncbi:hypothetical protein OSB04_000562 [Centaurea solstitialis]|uniref:Reverse transcriptase Ty1/copia-type domain-containing protein n=1 Tax=Centaurea solstitialis TaxID=347529 RepID=A0AA38TZV4_9ASTR|nr:hypothetical protein OSB04_000562 [Centaurea solstitialis]